MNKSRRSHLEFIALMAALMSVAAVAIDALLPALNIIGSDLNVTDARDIQLLIIMIFLGLGIGPLLFGPISDSLGRKPIVYMGFAIFIFASFICIYAPNLEVMVAGRILQGIGLSAPRTISISMIRDCFSGDYMARIMSFVTVIFLLVPILAPAMGQIILNILDWKAIFYVQIVFTIFIAIWFYFRQKETLHEEYRIPLTKDLFINSTKEVLKYRETIGYTLISGFITGSFMVYLSTTQQIFQNQYGLMEEFPYIFAGLAISVGAATLLNGTLVMKYGMERIVTLALFGFCAISLSYLVLFFDGINPGIGVILTFFAIQFFAIGFLFGNIRALAMQPVGHVAGIGAAITGFISTLMAVPISMYIGREVTTSALPLFVGFLLCSVASIMILYYLKFKKKRELADVEVKAQ